MPLRQRLKQPFSRTPPAAPPASPAVTQPTSTSVAAPPAASSTPQQASTTALFKLSSTPTDGPKKLGEFVRSFVKHGQTAFDAISTIPVVGEWAAPVKVAFFLASHILSRHEAREAASSLVEVLVEVGNFLVKNKDGMERLERIFLNSSAKLVGFVENRLDITGKTRLYRITRTTLNALNMDELVSQLEGMEADLQSGMSRDTLYAAYEVRAEVVEVNSGVKEILNVVKPVNNHSRLPRPPPPPNDFVGRSVELDSLKTVFTASTSSGKRHVLLVGLGGIGKTSLARKMLEEAPLGVRTEFLPCSEVRSGAALLVQLFRLRSSPLQPGEEPYAALETELSKSSKTWLVLDNFETPWEADEERVKEVLEQLRSFPASFKSTFRPFDWPTLGNFFSSALRSTLRIPTFPSFSTNSPVIHCPFASSAQAATFSSLKPVLANWRSRGHQFADKPGKSKEKSLAISLDMSFSSPSVQDAPLIVPFLSFFTSLPDGLSLERAQETPGTWAKLQAPIQALLSTSLASLNSCKKLYLLPPVRQYLLVQPPIRLPEPHLISFIHLYTFSSPTARISSLCPLRPPRCRIYCPPPPPAFWAGRFLELNRMSALFADPSSPHILLAGTGGIGKTALALQFMYEAPLGCRTEFIPCHECSTGENILYRILHQLIHLLRLAGEDPYKVLEAELADWKRTYLVLDALEVAYTVDPDGVKEVVEALSDIANLRLIVTTRTGGLAHENLLFTEVEVSSLMPAESVELFLRDGFSKHANDPALPSLIAELGGHPLAIQLVSAQAAQVNSLELILDDWRRRRKADMNRPSLDLVLDLVLSSPTIHSVPHLSPFLFLLTSLPYGFSVDRARRVTGAWRVLQRPIEAVSSAELVEFDHERKTFSLFRPVQEYLLSQPAFRLPEPELLFGIWWISFFFFEREDVPPSTAITFSPIGKVFSFVLEHVQEDRPLPPLTPALLDVLDPWGFLPAAQEYVRDL
ncbi:hypothetical protein JCM8547_002867 [Rhodosporidiobolus lusitaniae]